MAAEVVVVGAGLAGLTAALNLARDGRGVRVLEKFDKVGGTPLAHPAVDVTPMETEPLGRFIGVELGEPEVTPSGTWNHYAYGYKVPMDLTFVNLKCVERGSRKTALDMKLYNLCADAGVKFEFGKPLVTQGDFAQLPPDSVIATGLYFEAFEALNIPYQTCFGYIGRGRTDRGPQCATWFAEYILDYAYYGSANGVVFCLYFAREPVRESEWKRFTEKQLAGQEGMVCTRWDYHEGPAPTAVYNNPRLFAGDKILAGTLSGMMDPFALFGVHGSLVSGKIAAMAHTDKAEAYALFKKYTRFFNRNLFIKRVFNGIPDWHKKRRLGKEIHFMQKHAGLLRGSATSFFQSLPGYGQLP